MKILFVTSSFVKKGSASIRNIALVNGLTANKCDVDVLTESWPASMVDNSLSLYIDPDVKIYMDHIKVIDMYFSRKNKIDSQSNAIGASVVKKIIQISKKATEQLYFFPDLDKEWIRCYKKNLPFASYDLIISSSDTKTSHFVAGKIAKKYKLPWFTYWGDPWEDDMGTRGIKKVLARYFEKKIIAACDRAFYVSEPTMKVIQSRYPQYKNIAFLRRAYLCEITETYKSESNKIVISYCGSIYYGRNPDKFLYSLIDYNMSQSPEKIHLEFYGIYPQEMIERFKNPYIHFYGQVDYEKVNDVTRHSNALLMFANPQECHQIPGKLFDYFGTNKCIIVVAGEKENAVENFIRSTKRCHIVRSNNIDFEIIKKWICEDEYHSLKEYSAKSVANDLLIHYKEINK